MGRIRKEQCRLAINVNGVKDHYYYCMRNKGHRGDHQINIREEVLLLEQLLDSRTSHIMHNKYPQFLKKVTRATKVLDFG